MLARGAMDVMEKPFVKSVMLARIGYILELTDLRRAADASAL